MRTGCGLHIGLYAGFVICACLCFRTRSATGHFVAFFSGGIGHVWRHLMVVLFTYLLTPWCTVLLEKLTGLQLVKKFPAFHGTRRLITAHTSVRHMSLSWTSPIQSIYPHPTSCRSILILSTHLRLGLPSGVFPSGFPTKTLYTPLSSPTHATCPANLILFDFITRTILGEEYRSFNSSLCNLLHSPVTSSLLGLLFLTETKYLTLHQYIQGVSKRALQLCKRIEIFTEDIHNVLNCQNVAKHTEFYVG